MAAKTYNLNKPNIESEQVIEILEGRHLLQEMKVHKFVSNDTNFENKKLMIITGPNASGKSIYIKQVGVIVFLSHIGSFVPAKSARIGVFDHFYTRILSTESVGSTNSAFMSDLNQIQPALLNSSVKSLILIDEFGKGTYHVDGFCLLTGIINYWIRKMDRCPYCLFTTHFYEIFNNHLICEQSAVIMKNMGFVLTDKALKYTYKLNDGVCLKSYAFNIARLCGINDKIIEEAEKIRQQLEEGNTIQEIIVKDQNSNINEAEEFSQRFLTLDVDDSNLLAVLSGMIRDYKQKLL